MTRYLNAKSGRRRQSRPIDLPTPRPTKETAKCCLAMRLDDGRPVIGFCGPKCVRRRR